MEDQLNRILFQISMLYLNAIFTWIVLVIIFVLILYSPRRMLNYFLKNMKIDLKFGGSFGIQKIDIIPDKAFKSKGAGGNGGKGKKGTDKPGKHDKDTVS